MEKFNHSEKKTLRALEQLIYVAKKYRQYPLSCNEGIFEDINVLGVDANGEVRALNFYHDVDLPSPYDIPTSSANVGIFVDRQAMERVIKNSTAWIREILKKCSQSQQKNLNDAISEQEWSKPMSKSDMMTRLGIDSYKKFNSWSKQYGIKEAGNRQTFTIRLDNMDKQNRSKLNK